MSFSATIPMEAIDEANALLDRAGFGPNNFSVPLRDGAAGATHAGLHSYQAKEFLEAVRAIPGVQVTVGTSGVNFSEHVLKATLEWSDPKDWYANPVMKGDQRVLRGKTWESLTDYNVWEPGKAAWREVVAVGYPEWVQPVGAVDAYARGARVTFKGQDWENTGSGANVWAPGVFGWVVI